MIRTLRKAVLPLTRSTYTPLNLSSKQCLEMENKYSCHNYKPLPVVCAKAEGVFIWDPEGKRYYDFLSAYSAVNQGHCHPKIIGALVEQAQKLTLCSRAFHSQVFAEWAKYMCEYFGYSSVLPMNTGAEGVESALKLARRWGYQIKKIPENEAIIIAAKENFHGRTIGVISMSTDPDCFGNYGPLLPGLRTIPYNDANALKQVLSECGDKVAALLLEPIQGEAGVKIPDKGYLAECHRLCKEHNVLFICDEIQTGIARTGKMLCQEHDDVRADISILGKAVSGGVFPVSAVLADREIMDVITPGTHGSTYGGNPLGCMVSMAALEVVRDENLVERSRVLGDKLIVELNKLKFDGSVVTQVRGKGLLTAIELDHSNPKLKGKKAYDICKILKDRGMLCKQTHENIIRLAPPLVITDEQMDDCISILSKTFTEINES